MGKTKRDLRVHVLSRDEHVSGAINELVEITGMPWHRAKNVILWRKKKGLGISVTGVLEPEGA